MKKIICIFFALIIIGANFNSFASDKPNRKIKLKLLTAPFKRNAVDPYYFAIAYHVSSDGPTTSKIDFYFVGGTSPSNYTIMSAVTNFSLTINTSLGTDYRTMAIGTSHFTVTGIPSSSSGTPFSISSVNVSPSLVPPPAGYPFPVPVGPYAF